ncbi:glycosyltransferase family 4 protein [Bradyrhizobium sp. WSM1417]|uniref:glycosyltransferase family 4 protein n=1 Tax=Bradyrhizobium sp. WSM1417 TaxID=754500 RepID=UPI0009FBBEBA|nr:glycosyltransferase family 4 protein [Bradyrhizobium sp. WSM1417]
MRVTFVLPTVEFSGGIRVVSVYARELMKMGHRVCLVSPPPKRRSFWSRLIGDKHGESEQARSFLDDEIFDHRVIDRWRPIRDEDVPDSDVVIATWWETAEWVNALSRSKGAKVYFIQHHEVFPYLPVNRCRATYRFPMHKIVIARWLKETMSAEYGDNSADLIPNSVDRSQFFAAPRGKQSVATVGALYSVAPFKGFDLTLRAVAQVRERVPHLRFCVFGSAYPVERLALPSYTEFLHLPSQDDIRRLYSRCDVWVTASRTEGFNLPAMEAMSCATPVVSTRTGWPEEAIVSKWNGILVDVEDVEGLTRGIEWVLSCDESAWMTMSRNAQQTAGEGSWEKSARLFESALMRAIMRSQHGEI